MDGRSSPVKDDHVRKLVPYGMFGTPLSERV
jgi:hypothetical protein